MRETPENCIPGDGWYDIWVPLGMLYEIFKVWLGSYPEQDSEERYTFMVPLGHCPKGVAAV